MGGVDGEVNRLEAEEKRRFEEMMEAAEAKRHYREGYFKVHGKYPDPCCLEKMSEQREKKRLEQLNKPKKPEDMRNCWGGYDYEGIGRSGSNSYLLLLSATLTGLLFTRASPEEGWLESAVRFYQKKISPELKRIKGVEKQCKFTPSCSEYMRESIVKYGSVFGIIKGLKRLYRCRPSTPEYGYDPVV